VQAGAGWRRGEWLRWAALLLLIAILGLQPRGLDDWLRTELPSEAPAAPPLSDLPPFLDDEAGLTVAALTAGMMADAAAVQADEPAAIPGSVERATPAAAPPTPMPVVAPTATIPVSTPTAAPSPSPAPSPTPRLTPVAGGQARLPILMYHYIRVVPDADDQIGIGLSVAPEVFAQQMDFLKREGYHPVTLAQAERALRGETGLPAKPVVLTFDDGYADFYTAAWPILRRHGFASTIFVITDLIDRPGYLTRPQVIELDRSGLVEVGSHTLTHPDLTALTPEEQRREIVISKGVLEGWLGRPIVSFSYPAGRYHAGVLELVQEAQYRVAVTTKPGQEQTRAAPLEWRRTRVHGPGSGEMLAVLLAD
jgi:peptidoglycan/xylan/chitin deacetylase (PgdA/CDA1 family)